MSPEILQTERLDVKVVELVSPNTKYSSLNP